MSETGRGPTPEHFKAAAWKAIRPVFEGEIPIGRLVFEYPETDGTLARIKITVERLAEGVESDPTEQIEDLRTAKTARTNMGWDDPPVPKSGKIEM